MFLEPFNSPYPFYSNLSDNQKSAYNSIKSSIDSLSYIDVQGNDSYVMLYLNELIQKLLTSSYLKNYYIDKIKFVKDNYKAEFLQEYCAIWLGDIYFYFDDLQNALDSWVDALNPEKIWILLSSKIISLKLNENIPITAHEALTYKKNITKYGKNNMELVVKYVDQIIQKDYSDNTISSNYFLSSDKKIETQPNLFTGCVFGYDVNAKYNKRTNRRKDYLIESLTKLTEYIGDVSRRAENAIREDLDMPRIGEGWISETDLYYKIKKLFNKYNVIQHYNSQWLGKQHIDVFIEEINVGIEYHGLQHFQPVEFFGGQEAFIENQKRDKKKIEKCKMNSTKLIVVTDGYNISDVINEIENLTTAST